MLNNKMEVKKATITPTVYGRDAIKKGEEIAKQLTQVIEKQKLYVEIKGRKYVKYEGWSTLGALIGATVRITKIEEKEKDTEFEVTAFAEVIMRGEVISSAFASCSNQEANWKGRDKYAIRSMAQTRATSKAFRIGLSWIVALAGYETTPAEEMPIEGISEEVKDEERQKIINEINSLLKEIENYVGKERVEEEYKQILKKFAVLNSKQLNNKQLKDIAKYFAAYLEKVKELTEEVKKDEEKNDI